MVVARGRIRDQVALTAAALVGGALLMAGALLAAVAPRSCAAACLAPIAIADRWDDQTAVPGYAGDVKKSRDWRNNGRWDHEAFTDQNANGLYDPGEPFDDANANGRYDTEFYSPTLTGYVGSAVPANIFSPGGDVGSQLTLAPAGPADESPGSYLGITPFECAAPLPGPLVASRESGKDIRAVDDALRATIASDPTAFWNVGNHRVEGSIYAFSPRVALLAVYDPRTGPAVGGTNGTNAQVDKVFAVFVDAMVGRGSATVRIVAGPTGAAQFNPPAANSDSPTAVPSLASWGRVKGIYR